MSRNLLSVLSRLKTLMNHCARIRREHEDLPNMIGPFEQGPDPVQIQVNTKWTRDHYRNNNNKKNNKKNKKNKQYKKYNKTSNNNKEDFPYDLIDKMINEREWHCIVFFL